MTDTRCDTDVSVAQRELTAEEERYQTMETREGADEYELRQQDRVIADARQMVPDYKKRLAAAIDDLLSVMSGATDTTDESAVATAQIAIDEAQAAL